MELIVEHIKKHPKAGAYLLEGYPRDKNQVEEFNKHVSLSLSLWFEKYVSNLIKTCYNLNV